MVPQHIQSQLFVEVSQEQSAREAGADPDPALGSLLAQEQRFHFQRHHAGLPFLVLTIQKELHSHLLFWGKEVINWDTEAALAVLAFSEWQKAAQNKSSHPFSSGSGSEHHSPQRKT